MYVSDQYMERDTAYLIHPIHKNKTSNRDLEDIVIEAEGLTRAIDINLIKTEMVNCSSIQAGSYFTKGIRERISADVNLLEPSVIIINTALSAVQQRNLEKEWNAKIIDRTGLILEIFGARAQTKEGRLQVELAALDYQKSRLVRSWTHLERQRGGSGFMGGPGERQIEIDRRLLSKRITRLKKELEDVRRTRDLGRKSRERIPFPIVSLLGYTNAGKSTFFNTVTNANVFAKDLLFATLDPTMRKITLPNNKAAIFADTVGFISDLPTHLIAAFRATLEQVTHSDVIVHLIDASRKDYEAQKSDVIKIMKDLGVEYDQDERIIEVYNKSDLLDEEQLENFERVCKTSNVPSCIISSSSNQGIDKLLEEIAGITSSNTSHVTYKIDIKDGKSIAWLYENGEIIDRSDSEEALSISLNLDNSFIEKFLKNHGYKPVS